MSYIQLLVPLITIVFAVTIGGTEFSTQEKDALSEFRQMINESEFPRPDMKEDDYLIRWIRTAGKGKGSKINFKFRNSTSYAYVITSGYDLEKAKKNLEETLQWRKKNDIENILKEDFSDFKKKYVYDLEVSKKDGKVIVFIDWDKWDFRALAEDEDPAKAERYVYYALEDIAEYARRANSHYVSLILDASKSTPEKHTCAKCKGAYYLLFNTYEKRYPELLKRYVNINAAPEFAEVTGLVSSHLYPETKEGVKLYDDNAEVYLKELDGFIERDQIPKKFIQKKPPQDWTQWITCAACSLEPN